MEYAGMTCQEIEAACAERLSKMTQAEIDAEDMAAQLTAEEDFVTWAESTQAASFGLTIAEYREGR